MGGVSLGIKGALVALSAVMLFGASSISPKKIALPPEPKPIVTEYKSEESEAWLWDTLMQLTGGDEIITAGIMGYFWRESFFRSDAVAGWPHAMKYKGEDHCKLFTERINKGLESGDSRDDFIRSTNRKYGGYGLGQWSSPVYLESLYDFAKEWGTTISDAKMQCAFTVQSIKEAEDGELWRQLQQAPTARSAGILIATLYDGTTTGNEFIGSAAALFYGEHAAVYQEGRT